MAFCGVTGRTNTIRQRISGIKSAQQSRAENSSILLRPGNPKSTPAKAGEALPTIGISHTGLISCVSS